MRLKDHLFYPLSVHPAIFGMTFGYITSLYEKQKQPFNDIWDYIHPTIQKVSKEQYLSGFYADAAENAFKEINARTYLYYPKYHLIFLIIENFRSILEARVKRTLIKSNSTN